jgi:guanylate kinase
MEDKIDNLIATYQPSDEAVAILAEVPILLLVGISGAGKDTIKKQLLATGDYHKIVTHTTRAPRENDGVMEQNGVEYHFIDKATSLQMLEEKKYIEANRYGNNIYGTSVAEFAQTRDEHRIAVADIDVNGVANFMRLAPKSTRPVFLTPPSYAVWRERWMSRYNGTKYSPEDYTSRLQTAIKEIEHVLAADYYFIVVNDNLDAAVNEVNVIAHSGRQDAAKHDEGAVLLRSMLADMQADL